MDIELMLIQINQDLSELAEEYRAAASNERLWAKGAPDQETAVMHEQNAAGCVYLADFYKRLSENPQFLINAVEG